MARTHEDYHSPRLTVVGHQEWHEPGVRNDQTYGKSPRMIVRYYAPWVTSEPPLSSSVNYTTACNWKLPDRGQMTRRPKIGSRTAK